MTPYLILVIALTSLACLLLLWCCCRVAAWADRRSYRPVMDTEVDNVAISGNTEAPPCPMCGVERPWGPQEMIFPDGGSETFWRCRSCGREYWSRDVAPGRCWGVGG